MSRQALLPVATIHAKPARSRRLQRAVTAGLTLSLSTADGEVVDAPELEAVLRIAADALAHGNDVVVFSADAELSPNETGRMLGVSRQYVDRLIDLGEIPARKLDASTHRRIRVADLVAYQQRSVKRRSRISDAVNTVTAAGAEY